MAAKGIATILSSYFNADKGKTIREFGAELKALTDAEKLELAEGVCAITGDTVAVKKES